MAEKKRAVGELYERALDDIPVLVYQFARGPNNRRATFRIYKYPEGPLCCQLEDEIGGAEVWLGAADLLELAEGLKDVAEAAAADEQRGAM